MSRRVRIGATLVTLLGIVGLVLPAAAATQTCREWRAEHFEWKTRVVRGYLGGAPQPELDAALFELLQREAWLTACDLSVEGARAELVGWRLVGRAPDHYATAVVESVLAQGGFDLDLRRWVAGAAVPRDARHAAHAPSARPPGAAH